MKKSKAMLIGAAVVCMGLFVRKIIKNYVYDAEGSMGNAAAPVNRAEKPKSSEKAPAAKPVEPKGRAMEPKKADEEPASAAVSSATIPYQNALAIIPQYVTPAKTFVERRKKQIIEKNRQAKK